MFQTDFGPLCILVKLKFKLELNSREKLFNHRKNVITAERS